MKEINPINFHSSIRPNPFIGDYIDEDCKYYYLPLFKKSNFSEIIENTVGSKSNKDKTELEMISSIKKAKSARCSHVKIPCDREDTLLIKKTIQACQTLDINVALQVCSSFLLKSDFVKVIKPFLSKVTVEWLLDEMDERIDIILTSLNKEAKDFYFSIPVLGQTHWKSFLSSKVFIENEKFYLYFGYSINNDSFLNANEVYNLLSRLRGKFKEKKFLPPKGVDLWDPRVFDDFDMEPFLYPCYQTQSISPQVKYSVIIPTYNNENHLQPTLRHLVKQSVGPMQFEIIVVDDGSFDETQIQVIRLIESLELQINFKYIYFPRERKRTMGDSQYRAGISRNLGVKNSEGEVLCFLDSDILVDEDYLKNVDKALKQFDVIQAKRVNLSEDSSCKDVEYKKIIETQHTIPTEKYWENFMQTKNWDQIPFNWKYVCTHSLSLKKEVFWRVGGLKRNFIYYGFEDTDLGYRLVKNGYKLHLLDEIVYHMFHENNRSEFMNLKSLRHNLLSRTAQIFYLHHLDEDIYTNLIGYMYPEVTFHKIGKVLMNILTLQFIWKRRKSVFFSLEN